MQRGIGKGELAIITDEPVCVFHGWLESIWIVIGAHATVLRCACPACAVCGVRAACAQQGIPLPRECAPLLALVSVHETGRHHLPNRHKPLHASIAEPARLPGFHTTVGGGGEKQPPEWYEEKGERLTSACLKQCLASARSHPCSLQEHSCQSRGGMSEGCRQQQSMSPPGES